VVRWHVVSNQLVALCQAQLVAAWVTGHKMNSAFYPRWDGKTSIGFWIE